MAEQQKSGGGGFVAWILVIALLGAVFWLASERNSRKWFLSTENGQLVIARGRSFPTGQRNIAAQDAEWGKAYGPIVLPKDAKPVEGEFDDRSQLDRALFEELLPLAKAAADKPDAASQAEAMQLAERASLLPGLTAQQIEQLQGLRGDLAYSAALGHLTAVSAQVEAARRLLDQAHERGGRHALQAARLSTELRAIGDRLAEAAAGRAPAIAPPIPLQPPPAPPPDAGTPDAGTPDAGR